MLANIRTLNLNGCLTNSDTAGNKQGYEATREYIKPSYLQT